MEEGVLFLLFIAVVVLLVRLSNFSMRLERLETQLLDQAQKLRDLTRRFDETATPQTHADVPQSKIETEQKTIPPEEIRTETVENIEPKPPLAETQLAQPKETEKTACVRTSNSRTATGNTIGKFPVV